VGFRSSLYMRLRTVVVGDYSGEMFALGFESAIGSAGLLESGEQLIDALVSLPQQKLQPFRIEHLQSQRGVELQQSDLQAIYFALEFDFIGGRLVGSRIYNSFCRGESKRLPGD
jgi:hypothetical protein